MTALNTNTTKTNNQNYAVNKLVNKTHNLSL